MKKEQEQKRESKSRNSRNNNTTNKELNVMTTTQVRNAVEKAFSNKKPRQQVTIDLAGTDKVIELPEEKTAKRTDTKVDKELADFNKFIIDNDSKSISEDDDKTSDNVSLDSE